MQKDSTPLYRAVCSAFGTVLREARTAKGWTQQQLADAAKADRSHISMLERGVQQPTLSSAFRFSHALGLPPHQLVLETIDIVEDGEHAS